MWKGSKREEKIKCGKKKKKKRKKKEAKTRKFGHFFFPIVKTLLWIAPVNAGPDGILGSTRNLPAGDYARSFGTEPFRKRCWNANQTGWPEMHLCTQNARGTVVATEVTTFRIWNVVGISRLLHLLFCVRCLFSRSLSLSLSLTLCADVRCVRDLQGLRGPSLWCCSMRKLWIPLLAEESPWQSFPSTCSCSWLDPSFWDVFRELVH